MTAAPTRNTTATGTADGERETLRLELKPKAATTGWVDGGWWPRSRDLAAELPSLVAVLGVELGPVERVSYHLGDWDPTPTRLVVAGNLVRLGGFRTQRAGTVDVLTAGQRVTLLVVPPETPPELARDALTSAGHRGNTDSIEALLTPRR